MSGFNEYGHWNAKSIYLNDAQWVNKNCYFSCAFFLLNLPTEQQRQWQNCRTIFSWAAKAYWTMTSYQHIIKVICCFRRDGVQSKSANIARVAAKKWLRLSGDWMDSRFQYSKQIQTIFMRFSAQFCSFPFSFDVERIRFIVWWQHNFIHITHHWHKHITDFLCVSAHVAHIRFNNISKNNSEISINSVCEWQQQQQQPTNRRTNERSKTKTE